MNLKLSLKYLPSLLLCVLWIIFTNINLNAQQSDSSERCRPMRREDISNIPPEERAIPYCSPKEPPNCEVANIYTDMAAYLARESENTYLIVIARLGDGEKSRRLNASRLKHVHTFLSNNRGVMKMVIAQGERKKGYGQLEFYVGGNLLFTLPVGRNKNIDLGSCNAV
jgi:hypothetical protein